MLQKAANAIRAELRRHPMARFAVGMMTYGLALVLIGRIGPEPAPALLWLIFWLAILPPIFYYLFRLSRLIKERLLWRLQWRLVVTYVFIAFVPVMLIVALAMLGVVIVSGQFASFLVVLRLREQARHLEQWNRAAIHGTRVGSDLNATVLLERLRRLYVDEYHEYAASFPNLEITIRVDSITRTFRLDGKPAGKPTTIPKWLHEGEFAGVVIDGEEIAVRAADQRSTPVGELTIISSEPITAELLDRVGAGIGPVYVIATKQVQPTGGRPPPERGFVYQTSAGEYVETQRISSRSVPIPPRTGLLDFKVLGASSLDPIQWSESRTEVTSAPVFVYVTSRIVALNAQLLTALGRFSQLYTVVFLVVAAIFFVIELFAIYVGYQMTRTTTRTVDKLYDATERVRAGDFAHRIRMPAKDQLSALGEAFDGMTASVERLLRESQEKTRLESELNIAREVQKQLFPQAALDVPGLLLHGICRPARAVSGDFYDYFPIGRDHVGMVVSDVSGKGISSALLMAAIQSALRAQFYTDTNSYEVAPAVLLSTSEIVGRLNRQLQAFTPPEKYVTMFYGVLNLRNRELTYTNAGHLYPMVCRQGAIKRLEVGGTVVGLFAQAKYDEEVVQLAPEDLLLGFTDGITEPENEYGEEFGEDRLTDVVRRMHTYPPAELAAEIYRALDDWTGGAEPADDMTILVAKLIP